jgi:hypothetical protein
MYLCSKFQLMAHIRIFVWWLFIFLVFNNACNKAKKDVTTPVDKVFIFKTAKLYFIKTSTEWVMDVAVPKNAAKQLYYFEVKFKGGRQRNVGHEFAPNETNYTAVLPIPPKDYPDIENVRYYIIEDSPPK